MIEVPKLRMFLSELTVLSRKYGIKIVDATRGCAEQVILVPFESDDANKFYLVEHEETLIFELSADSYSNATIADEHYIKILEAGLE